MKSNTQKHYYYPCFLDIRGKKSIVIGGGRVSLRKVKSLLEHGANVEVISPDLCSELDELARTGAIKAVLKKYKSGDIRGAFLAIAATDSNEINQEVADEARRRNILVNVVDKPEHSDFIFPSYLRRGDISIAVSTNGTSPALARKIRTELEQDFGDEYADLVELIKEIRSELRNKSASVNGDEWQKALELDQLLELLRNGKRKEAKSALLSKLGTLNNGRVR